MSKYIYILKIEPKFRIEFIFLCLFSVGGKKGENNS